MHFNTELLKQGWEKVTDGDFTGDKARAAAAERNRH
jgi:hypothetical protein